MTEAPNSSEDSAALSACKEWSTYVSMYIVHVGRKARSPSERRNKGAERGRRFDNNLGTGREGVMNRLPFWGKGISLIDTGIGSASAQGAGG